MIFNDINLFLRKKLFPEIFLLKNSFYGLQYGNPKQNKVINKILLTLDLNIQSIHFALLNKINLIISYRGLLNTSIQKFNQNLINKLSLLSKYPVSIFVLDSTLVAAEEGISDTIASTLYFDIEKTFNITNGEGNHIPIGRICYPKEYFMNRGVLDLEQILKRIKSNFEIECLSYVGDLNKPIKKVCIVGSDLIDIKVLENIKKLGCDTYISCGINYDVAIYAKEVGLNLIKIPNYNCEIKTLRKFCNFLSLEFPNDEFFTFDSNNLINIY
jgi:putative NIF3 family GTP cyclohydrolase 1 type 2